MRELYEQLQDWGYLFFFYEGGINEAISILISTYEHPELVAEMGGENIHPVINDVDMYMTALDRCNASISYPPEVMDMLELAIQGIEQAITEHMCMLFGDWVFKVVEAIPLNDHHDYAITINLVR